MEQPTSELRTVTPEQATVWLKEANYERQRRVAPWQVERLSIEMQRGRFVAGTQIHFGVLNGCWRLVNGQHTLGAIVKSGIATPLTVLVTPVADDAELGGLYMRHDRHRARTPHDAFASLGLAATIGLGERQTSAFARGLKVVLNDFRRVGVHADVELATSLDWLADRMIKWAPVAQKYFTAINPAAPAMKHRFERVPVLAIGLATFRNAEAKAEIFWRTAAEDDGLRRNDPRKAMLNVMIAKTAKAGDPLLYVKTIAGLWNAFMEGRRVTNVRPIDITKVGVTLLGTHHRARPPYRQSTSAAAPLPTRASTQVMEARP